MEERCPACGSPLPDDTKRCPSCGIRLPASAGSGEEGGTGPWTPVFQGEMTQVLPLRAALGASGIPAYIRDERIKNLDPFLTGGYGFSVTLMVPSSRAREALEKIGGKDWKPSSASGGEKGGTLEDLADRIRWAALCMVTAPIGLAYLPFYLRRVARRGEHPKGHGLTLAAGLLCLFLTLFFCWSACKIAFRDMPPL